MKEMLVWIGGAVVIVLVIIGLAKIVGLNVHTGNGYVGVSFDRTDCNCDSGYVSPADEQLLRRVYK